MSKITPITTTITAINAIQITLDLKEAAALHIILGSIHGLGPIRSVANSIFYAIHKVVNESTELGGVMEGLSLATKQSQQDRIDSYVWKRPQC